MNIFLFYGEDSFSSTHKLNTWKNEFAKKYNDDTNVEVIEGKKLDINNFRTNLEAVPFLAEKRLVIVNNFLTKGKKDAQKKVADVLEKTPDFCVLIFHEIENPDKRTSLYKKIVRLGKVSHFPTLSGNAISKWIIDRAKLQNTKIDFQTANYLGEHCGYNLWTISNELEKLELFANDKPITTEMIDQLISPALSTTIFKLTDAIAAKNTKQSLKVFKMLIDSNEDVIKIFFMIVRHFRILIQVHEMVENGESPYTITKRLKQHPFVIQTMSKQSHNFTQKKLEEIYKELLEIDIQSKTGKIKTIKGDTKEYQLAVEKLIINCCN